MNLNECQREMRFAFLGGFAGQLVSGAIWLAASDISLWGTPGYGMAVLFFGSRKRTEVRESLFWLAADACIDMKL